MEESSQSAARRISVYISRSKRTDQEDLDDALLGPSTSLRARLHGVRARSVLTSHGRFRAPYLGTDGEGESELSWNDCILTWTRGCQLIRTFTFSQPVLQAFWTYFEAEPIDNTVELATEKPARRSSERPLSKALCVFFQQAIQIYIADLGEQIELDLPFRFAKAFPAPVGFLVQRQIEAEDENIAIRLRKASSAMKPPTDSSAMGYPFPNTNIIDDVDDTLQEARSGNLHVGWDAQDSPGRMLPMVFYLRRSFDDLAPVDRFPQLSSAQHHGQFMTHGPPSPFAEIDETIIFVSTGADDFAPHIVVTADHASSAIKIYAFAASTNRFEATSTLLSVPRQWPLHNRQPSGFASRSKAAAHIDHAVDHAENTANATSIGKGFPQLARRSSRLDHDRRVSGLASVTMGRDPSGRSRRISALHTGSGADRRSIIRTDEGTSQGRDRTVGNISQTVDNLRRQSQLYTHETLLDELAPMTSSLRTSAPQNQKARLRRSSQAARTPYNAPRMSSRQSSSASRTRPSMNISRADLLQDYDTQATSNVAPGASRLDFAPHDAVADSVVGYPQEDVVDLEDIADLAGFAVSFACVSLLEIIPIKPGMSQKQLAQTKVSAGTFFDVDDDAHHILISVPGINKTFRRYIGRRTVMASNVPRYLMYSGPMDKDNRLGTSETGQATLMHTTTSRSPQIVTMDSNAKCTISFDPSMSTQKFALDLPSLRGDTTLESAPTEVVDAQDARLSLTSGEVGLDFKPSCQLTKATLDAFALCLPSSLSERILAAWVERRFLHKQRKSVANDWTCLTQVLCLTVHDHKDGDDSTLSRSASHRRNGCDILLAGLSPLNDCETTPVEPELKPILLHGLDIDLILMTLHLLGENALLNSLDSTVLIPQLGQLIVLFAQEFASLTYADFWLNRLPDKRYPIKGHFDRSTGAGTRLLVPKDIHTVLLNLLSGTQRSSNPSAWFALLSPDVTTLRRLDIAFPNLHAILQIYATFGDDQKADTLAQVLVAKMTDLGFNLTRLKRLPFGIAAPLFEALRCCQLRPPDGQTSAFYHIIQRFDLVLKKSSGIGSKIIVPPRQASQTAATTLPDEGTLDPVCAQLFNKDFRLVDVVNMLQTTNVNSTYVSEGENQAETAISDQHAAAVAALSERTKAVAIGRGMLFMASRGFSPTAKWRVAPICLKVKVQPRGLTIEPDTTKSDPTGLDWPEFHNGVASILEARLSAGMTMDSKWIFAHLGEQVTSRHAGFLLGLGLMKRLPALTPVHVFRYLEPRNNLLTIGFLLGMAASTIGTADPTARHLIGMQLIAFLPPGSAPLNLSMITQTAGMLAMGLVFLGSNHRWTAKRMLEQIGAQETASPHIQPQHREAYSLSAGLALGLVYLGKGRSDGMKSLPDKKTIARLVQLIEGQFKGVGPRTKAADDQRLLLDAELNLTSIPASLALGFIFLRSGRKDIANVLAPPRTVKELDLTRPDVLFMHVLARHLVLWDRIKPESAWVTSVLPEWMQKQLRSGETLSESAQLAHVTMRAAACFALGLKFAGSRDTQAQHCLWEQLNKLQRETQQKAVSYFLKIRKAAAQSALDQVIVALSMVMSGSGDIEVLRLLRKSHGEVGPETCYGTHMATHMALGLLFLGGGRFTLGTSDVAVAALTIALMPPFPRTSSDNRAHLQAFRHLWILAVEPRLLIATDVDTGEMASLPIQIESGLESHKGEREFTPLLLPRFQDIVKVSTATSRYWPTQIDLISPTPGSQLSQESQVLYVKRKTGHLGYSSDPRGSRSTFSRALGTAPLDLGENAADLVGPSVAELREMVDAMTGANKYSELIDSICGAVRQPPTGEDSAEASMQSMMRVLTMECLKQDKAYILPAYTTLAHLRHDDKARQVHYTDVCFMDVFYRQHYSRLFSGASLFQQGLISLIREQALLKAHKLFDNSVAMRFVICRYFIARVSGTRMVEMLSLKELATASRDFVDLDDLCFVLQVSQLPALEDRQRMVRAIEDTFKNGTSRQAVQAMLKMKLNLFEKSGAMLPKILDLVVEQIADLRY